MHGGRKCQLYRRSGYQGRGELHLQRHHESDNRGIDFQQHPDQKRLRRVFDAGRPLTVNGTITVADRGNDYICRFESDREYNS